MDFNLPLHIFKNIYFKRSYVAFGCLSVIVFLIFSLLFASKVLAYKITKNDMKDEPYKSYDLGNVSHQENILLGKLNNFPMLYTFSLNKDKTFNFVIRQPDLKTTNFNSPQPLTLLLVKKNDSSQFTEIARIQTEVKDWRLVKDKKLGLKMWEMSAVTLKLASSDYNLEISSPDNVGYYQLVFGKDDNSVGYVENLQKVIFIRDFFGYHRLSVLKSQLVYIPFILIFLTYVSFKLYRYLRRFKT